MPVPTLLTYSKLLGGGEIHKYEAQSRNLVENSDFCSHYDSRLLLLSVFDTFSDVTDSTYNVTDNKLLNRNIYLNLALFLIVLFPFTIDSP